jgi:hypothetical protein
MPAPASLAMTFPERQYSYRSRHLQQRKQIQADRQIHKNEMIIFQNEVATSSNAILLSRDTEGKQPLKNLTKC